ncbi:unnamed protein product [Staurois parvus]|uniref:Uncharacterized protein n=1 Tax=Staurois parvus TaxID=386267 RepID=A0ABN9ASY2_9NEOB|nr:unnamed protein product [Staurois parvus]
MVSEEHTVDADYDDEYDDTYDGNQIGANDADSDDELISRRPFTIPQVLRSRDQENGVEEEIDDDEAEDEAVPKPDHFIQDPAVLRERAEAEEQIIMQGKVSDMTTHQLLREQPVARDKVVTQFRSAGKKKQTREQGQIITEEQWQTARGIKE